MPHAVHLTRTLPHPPEAVWAALTEADVLGGWLMRNDFAPELGRYFNFRKDPQPGWDGVIHCEVTELVPGRRLAYSWRGQATGQKTLACAGVEDERIARVGKGVMTTLDTVVTYTLEPVEGGTRLVFSHTGFEGLKGFIVSRVMGMGWRKIFGRLDATLQARRTAAA